MSTWRVHEWSVGDWLVLADLEEYESGHVLQQHGILAMTGRDRQGEEGERESDEEER